MAIDLRQSRRTHHLFCRWWKRNEDDQYTPDELIYKRVPTGRFWAEEVSPVQDRDNIVGGVFNFDSMHVTLESPDDCSMLESKDLVEYQGEKWIVVSVQRSKARVNSTIFLKEKYCPHYWYIELRQ